MPHDVPIPDSKTPLEQELKEALEAEKNLFKAWNDAKERVRKAQEALLVERGR